MFRDLTAWFSTSVDDRNKQLWRGNGGTETDFDHAQMIFSADNTCPDTERIFNSKEYQSEHLAVFHSRYISDRVRAGEHGKIVLGNYYLPPPDIVALVKSQLTFCWELRSASGSNKQGDSLSRQPSATQASTSNRHDTSNETSRPQQRPVDVRAGGQQNRSMASRPQSTSQQQHRQRLSASDPKDQGTGSSTTHCQDHATSSRRKESNLPDSDGRIDNTHINSQDDESQSGRKRNSDIHLPSPSSPWKRTRQTSSSSPSAGMAAASLAEQQKQVFPRSEKVRDHLERENLGDHSGHRVTVVVDVRHSASEHVDTRLGRADARDGSVSTGPSYFLINSLAKVTGMLEDFTPGQNGCEVYLKPVC